MSEETRLKIGDRVQRTRQIDRAGGHIVADTIYVVKLVRKHADDGDESISLEACDRSRDFNCYCTVDLTGHWLGSNFDKVEDQVTTAEAASAVPFPTVDQLLDFVKGCI